MVFYFSGTGNSQLAAVQIAEATGDGLVSVNRLVKLGEPGSFQSERPLVFVAPTYSWRLPRVVEQWMEAAEFAGNKDAYFVLTCGGSAGNAAKYAQRLCERKGLAFRGLAEVAMPENYLALGPTPEAGEVLLGQVAPEGGEEPAVLPLLRARLRVRRGRRVHLVREMRGTLSPEQRGAGRRQARVERELHPLHGLHCGVPRRGHRVQERVRGPPSPLRDGRRAVLGRGNAASVAERRPAAPGGSAGGPGRPGFYFPATRSAAISRSLNFCTFMDGVMGKSSTKNTRLGTL